MAIIDLGKIKLSYRGAWTRSNYSPGDIVTLGSRDIDYFDESVNYHDPNSSHDGPSGEHNRQLFIFKGNTQKSSYPYIPTQVVAVKNGIATTGVSTNIVEDVLVYLGLTTQTSYAFTIDGAVVPGCSYFHHDNFPSNTKIVGITSAVEIDESDGKYGKYTLKLNKYSVGTGTTECVSAVVGTRRVGNRYEIALNTEDWDIYSQGMTYSGEFSKYRSYVPGDIVTKTHDDGQVSTYICITPIGPGSNRPIQNQNSSIIDTALAKTLIENAPDGATDDSVAGVVIKPEILGEKGKIINNWDQYTGQGTLSNIRLGTNSNLGGSFFALTPDPEFDCLGVWQSFMTSDLEPHQKATLLPNNQPVDWKGHPYVRQAAWSNIHVSPYYWNGLNTNLQYGKFSHILGSAETVAPYTYKNTTKTYDSLILRMQWFNEGRKAYIVTAGRQYMIDVADHQPAYTVTSVESALNYAQMLHSSLQTTLSLSVNFPDTKVYDAYCRSDGKRVWILTEAWSDGVDTWNFLQYDMTSPFDMGTMTNPVLAYVQGPGRDDTGGLDRIPARGFTFSPNGRFLYTVGRKENGSTRNGASTTDGDTNAISFISKYDLRFGPSHLATNGGLGANTGAWNVAGTFSQTSAALAEGNLRFGNDGTADEFRIDNIQFSTDGLTLYALGTTDDPDATHNRLDNKKRILSWNLGKPYDVLSIIDKEVIIDNFSYANPIGAMWVGSSGGSSYKKTMERLVLIEEYDEATPQQVIWGGYDHDSDYARDYGDSGHHVPPGNNYLSDNNNEWEYSRVVQKYQGGKPWHLPNDIKFEDHHWRWNTSKQKVTESAFSKIHFVDGEGNTKSLGGAYSYDNDRIQAGGYNYPSGYTGESTAPIDVEFLSDETPGYGNSLFDDSLEPRTKIIQYLRFHHCVWTLQSNGIVSFAGDLSNGDHSLLPYGTDENLAVFNGRHEIARDVFKGRSIVKLSGFQDSTRTNNSYEGAIYALDEAGELWSWGAARLGLLGIGSENITLSQQNYAGITTTGDNGGFSAPDNVDDIQSNAPWCLGKEAFGGRKVVDFEVSANFIVIAMDDHGDIWTWGNNTQGELGFPTMEGFVSTACARRPQLVTSPLGYSFQGEGLDASTAVRTQYITGSSGSTYDMEILEGGTKVKRRDSTGVGHDAGVSVNVGYAQTVAVSASFDTIDQYQYFGLDDVVATGNASGNTDHIDYMWYGYGGGGSDYGDLWIWMNGSSITKVGEYNHKSVMSIVYDPNDGFVNWYLDKDGDGISNRLIYRRKKDVVSGEYDTLLYPSFGMYGATSGDGTTTTVGSMYGEAARGISNIQITDRIVRKTWKDYGGIQKFIVRGGGSWPTTDDIGSSYMILDGQGYLWNTTGQDLGCAMSGDGDLWEIDVEGFTRGNLANTTAIDEGDSFTAPGLTGTHQYYALSRKKLPGRYSAVKTNSNSNPYSIMSNLSVGLQGRINNIWRTGVTDNGTLMSVTGISTNYGGIGETHSETWYMGYNTNYQATTSTTNTQRLPVQVKASGISGGNRNAIDHNVGTNNVDHNVYLQDIVMASSGGGIAGVGAVNQSINFVMDKHGYLYAFGYNQYGVSGTSVNQNNSVSSDANNITYQHESLDNSWPRVYTPNHMQGKCIDLVVFGEHYSTTYVDYNNAAVALFQFDDASLLWCGENNPSSNSYAYHELMGNIGISIMKTLSGFH